MILTHTRALRIAAAFGLAGVALGAFGAHGLKGLLIRNEAVGIWEKAVFFQMVHVVVLLFLVAREPLPKGPWLCFLIGIVLFSGSLYLLAVTHARWVGVVTPFGGLSFLAGWLWLILRPGGAVRVTR